MTQRRGKLIQLHRRVETAVAADDRLRQYFRESLCILDRVLDGIAAPAADDDHAIDHQRFVHELEFDMLAAFLQAELDAHTRRQTLQYRRLDVTEHGLIGDGKTNCRAAFDRLIVRAGRDAKPLHLFFPRGSYRFAGPSGKAAGSIVLEDVDDLILEGEDGTRIITSGAFGAGDSIRLERCRNVVLRRFEMDLEPLPFVFGRITATDETAAVVELKLAPDSPLPDAAYEEMLKTAALPVSIRRLGTCRYVREAGNSLAAKSVALIGNRRCRLQLTNGSLQHIPVGASAVLHPRGRPGAGQGLKILHSRHILVDRIHLQAADLVCVWPEYSGGLQFIDCDFVPPAGRPALVNADGFHVPRNAKGPYLENCRILGANDDCLNFYSPGFSVARRDADRRALTILVDFPGKLEDFFQAGEPVALLNTNTGRLDAVAVIEGVRRVDWAPEVPAEDLRAAKVALELTLDRTVNEVLTRDDLGRPKWGSYNEYWKRDSPAYKAAAAVKAPHEHFAFNLRWLNSGFILRHCTFGHNRALGFKCKAGNGVIRNCRFVDQALLFETSLTWREGFLPHDIEVSNTRIDRFCFSQLGLLSGVVKGERANRLMPRIYFRDCVVAGKRLHSE